MKMPKVLMPLGSCLLVCLFSTSLPAQEEPSLSVSLTESADRQAAILQFANLAGARTQVVLIDAQGVTKYKDVIWNEDNYAARLKMTGLPAGAYLLHVANKNGQFARGLQLSETGVEVLETRPMPADQRRRLFSETKSRMIARFGAAAAHKNFTVQLSNLSPGTVRWSIVGRTGGLVAQQTIREESNGFAKQFNLKHLAPGEYYFYLKTETTGLWQALLVRESGIALGALHYPAHAAGDQADDMVFFR